ncbi:MAG TPA: hypothetical protein VF260_09805 [Bacilli bacterium]
MPKRNPIQSEQGAALVIALLAVVVMTMFGIILLQVLRGSMVQATSSEAAVQAEANAQRGIDDALALIRNAVERGNAEGADYRDKIARANDYLDRVKAYIASGSPVNAKRGTYEIAVEEDTGNYASLTASPITVPDFPYVRMFTIKATGKIANHPGGIAAKRMRVIVSTINPVFRYPLSADNNITLNGSPYIVGDVLARDGNVAVSDVAVFTGLPGTKYGKKTDYPSVKGFINYGGEIVEYVPGTTTVDRHSGDVDETFFSKAVPLRDKQLAAGEPVAAADYVSAKLTEMAEKVDAATSPFDENVNSGDLFGASLGSSLGAVIGHSVKYEDLWVTVQGNLTLDNPAGLSDFAVKDGVLRLLPGANFQLHHGSLYISYNDPNVVAADLSGALAVDPGWSVVINGNCTLNDGFYFAGNMYIKGDLKVVGSINIDGTIYVDGGVELKQMTAINDSVAKPLIIVATRTFDFSDNISANSLRAFFYANEDINLRGVLSKIKIYGGVHGNNAILNAVREDFANPPTDPAYIEYDPPIGATEPTSFMFTMGQTNLAAEQSKLQIFYDSKLYSDPPVGIPTTSEVSVFVKEIDTVK